MLSYRLEGDGALDHEPEVLYHYTSLAEAVCKIVQGPLARPEVGESSLKEFLEAKNYGHVEATGSGIPLRAL
jgi:hypothetical protein